MNIFLTSSFAEVVDLFVRFTGGECRGRTVTLIPTASLAEEVNSYLLAAKDALVKAGLVIDELDVSSASRDEIVGKLERGDYIYVSGGNTFFLLQELKRTGADLLIAEAYSFEKRIKFHLDYATLAANAERLGCKRIVLTHMGPEMLSRLGEVECECAEDGKIIVL